MTEEETDAYFAERLRKLKLKRGESRVSDVRNQSTSPGAVLLHP
jgi:hypothetical protein